MENNTDDFMSDFHEEDKLEMFRFDESIHHFYINDEITNELATSFIKAWNIMLRDDELVINHNKKIVEELGGNAASMEFKLPEIYIHINSYGGECYAGLAIYDKINSEHKYHKTSVCSGAVMSMAVPISLAADYVTSYENTTFLIHQVSGECSGKTLDVEESVSEMKRLNNILFDIIMKRTSLTEKEMKKIYETKTDKYITAEDALSLGIIDKLIV